jgi:hypothetical protein
MAGAVQLDPETLRQALARRARDQQVVMVLHPDVVLDDVAFEAANTNVTVRRSRLVGEAHRVVVFDLADLVRGSMAFSDQTVLDLGPGRPESG